MENVSDKPKSKEEYIKDLVKALAAIDYAIEPFKDQRKDIKKSYVDNGWLSADELKYVQKAYNFAKKGDFDIDKFVDAFNKIK